MTVHQYFVPFPALCSVQYAVSRGFIESHRVWENTATTVQSSRNPIAVPFLSLYKESFFAQYRKTVGTLLPSYTV